MLMYMTENLSDNTHEAVKVSFITLQNFDLIIASCI